MSALELRIPPLVLALATLLLIVAVNALWPVASVAFPGQRTVSIAAIACGLVVTLGAGLQFRIRRTTLDPRTPAKARHFVASGMFRISRNPMYLGMALLLLGAANWGASVLAYALVLVFCLCLTEFQIKPEERALEATFGSQYLEYKAKVRRWI